ncbi:hypothetical protein [Nocardioides convexus]|uniref:DUF7168 domain-containing protein n=1 Tax=Nocardioides convexus TaxID=2712224 RepID=UPI0024188812|nr:hypothetical protein [Nocardioides convexus]
MRVAIYTSNTRVTLYGFPTDIAVVKALYASLVTQMVADGDAHLRSGAHKADTRQVWDVRRRRWELRPVHGSTARAAFYEAWADHVGERLARSRDEARAAAIAAEPVDPATPARPTSTEPGAARQGGRGRRLLRPHAARPRDPRHLEGHRLGGLRGARLPRRRGRGRRAGTTRHRARPRRLSGRRGVASASC